MPRTPDITSKKNHILKAIQTDIKFNCNSASKTSSKIGSLQQSALSINKGPVNPCINISSVPSLSEEDLSSSQSSTQKLDTKKGFLNPSLIKKESASDQKGLNSFINRYSQCLTQVSSPMYARDIRKKEYLGANTNCNISRASFQKHEEEKRKFNIRI